MATRRPTRDSYAASIANISRTRRAQLVAEFEGDLGIDHKERARLAYEEKRWRVIKTIIVWTIALMFFAIACHKLWLMGQQVDRPFSDLDPIRGLLGG
ncbi:MULTISPECIES: hypothetical protein [Sphingopyxis]|jgi:hypothetical protein|uniref:hypothetical protein n=1 Tax=Sphingopyxis TaxID=165697 RepID=UPI0008361D3E|nr:MULTISPECIES: hypothetical protein [Sphingopyxis]APW73374.1 hypothetical protein BWD40_11635 [Sphingopyxis granuli]AVA14406.1 hypothetical protein C3E99_11585 [Sphingopyxis sp. MG]ODU27392.1 MAG: hypothetical protein ABS88_16475 [Sphingopyxis sp. SCN 67-31]QUM73705.1 hypothetical protein ICN83_07530 [Sphingopyxis granuli]